MPLYFYLFMTHLCYLFLLISLETAPVPAVRSTVQRTTVSPATAENGEKSGKAVVVDEERSDELIVGAADSTENTSNTNMTTVQSTNGQSNGNGAIDDKIPKPVVEENLSELNIHQNGKDTAATVTSSVDENETARQSSLSPGPGSFSRNSTLTRSQRKKVTPQVNIIKNMIIGSNTYSPPVIDPTMSAPSFPSNHDGAAASTQLNGDKSDVNENFIISSLAQKQQNEGASHSDASDHQQHLDHPLSISTSASHNSLSEFALNGGNTHELCCAIIHPFLLQLLLTTFLFSN